MLTVKPDTHDDTPPADAWMGCYSDSWQEEIVDEAFAHPAKFSRALIRRIYEHAKEHGWIQPGAVIVDPFGGVGLGALDAMWNGCHWFGYELEYRFVSLGSRNLERFTARYGSKQGWGSALLFQGDSRRLTHIIQQAACIVSSPPYAELMNQSGGGIYATGEHTNTKAGQPLDYGQTPGQLGALREGDIAAVISSPPFLDAQSGGGIALTGTPAMQKTGGGYAMTGGYRADMQGHAEGQLANATPDTFWQASRTILEQCYQLLAPHGVAIFVCKDYVRNKKRVPFSDNWVSLCESVGFRLVCRHRAMLVEEHGEQGDLFRESLTMRTERKSFFRRLAEKKGSPRIDHEDVLCFRAA